MAKAKAKNRKYIERLKLQLKGLPGYIMAHAANQAFEEVVYATAVDSGQARAQWYMVPYKTNYTMYAQEILWGYTQGGMRYEPVAPVGFKYDKGEHGQEVADFVLQERTLRVETLMADEWNGVIVYNPITPNFPGFAPNSDANYKEYAFRNVDFDSIQYRALRYAYEMAAQNYDFVKLK